MVGREQSIIVSCLFGQSKDGPYSLELFEGSQSKFIEICNGVRDIVFWYNSNNAALLYDKLCGIKFSGTVLEVIQTICKLDTAVIEEVKTPSRLPHISVWTIETLPKVAEVCCDIGGIADYLFDIICYDRRAPEIINMLEVRSNSMQVGVRNVYGLQYIAKSAVSLVMDIIGEKEIARVGQLIFDQCRCSHIIRNTIYYHVCDCESCRNCNEISFARRNCMSGICSLYNEDFAESVLKNIASRMKLKTVSGDIDQFFKECCMFTEHLKSRELQRKRIWRTGQYLLYSVYVNWAIRNGFYPRGPEHLENIANRYCRVVRIKDNRIDGQTKEFRGLQLRNEYVEAYIATGLRELRISTGDKSAEEIIALYRSSCGVSSTSCGVSSTSCGVSSTSSWFP